MKIYKIFAAIGALALACGFTACNDDDTVYDYPGVDGQVVLAPTKNEAYKFVKTPAGIVTPTISWKVTPRARINSTEEVKVLFEIDNTLIDKYNAENGTSYVALPEGLVSIVNPEITFAEGAIEGDTCVMAECIDNPAVTATLDLSTEYMVPVRMTTVTKGNARIAVSASNVSYLTFAMSEKLINDTNGATPTGTKVEQANRQAWSATVGDGGSEWYGWSNPIVGGSGWANMSYGSYPAGSSVTFDLGRAYTFDGIYAYPYYGSSSYRLFRIGTEIFISSDGNSWTSLGEVEVSTNTVVLYAPMTARYIKAVLGTNGYVACQEFSIFEK